jgi:hypothetical protein
MCQLCVVLETPCALVVPVFLCIPLYSLCIPSCLCAFVVHVLIYDEPHINKLLNSIQHPNCQPLFFTFEF